MSVAGGSLARLDPRRASIEALLLGTVGIWALNFTAVKYAISNGFSPLSYAVPRYALAGIILGAFVLRRERSLRIERQHVPVLIGAALIGISLNQLTFVYALHFATAATIALLFGTAPVLVALLAHFSGNERLGARNWFGSGLSFAGVSLVVASTGGISTNLGGLLLGLTTAATWAVYSVLVAPLMGHYSAYRLNATVTLLGSVPLFFVAAPQLADERWSRIGTLAWLAMAFSLLAYVFGNTVWFHAILRVGPSRAALFVNLEPLLGAVFAVLILSEGLTILQVVGGVVITVGIFVARNQPPQVPLTE